MACDLCHRHLLRIQEDVLCENWVLAKVKSELTWKLQRWIRLVGVENTLEIRCVDSTRSISWRILPQRCMSHRICLSVRSPHSKNSVFIAIVSEIVRYWQGSGPADIHRTYPICASVMSDVGRRNTHAWIRMCAWDVIGSR